MSALLHHALSQIYGNDEMDSSDSVTAEKRGSDTEIEVEDGCHSGCTKSSKQGSSTSDD